MAYKFPGPMRPIRADAGEFLTGLEFFEDPTLELALRKAPSLKWPLQGRSPFYVLAEDAVIASSA